MRAAEVRDDVSRATDRTCVIGTRDANKTLRTFCLEATQAPGTILSPGMR